MYRKRIAGHMPDSTDSTPAPKDGKSKRNLIVAAVAVVVVVALAAVVVLGGLLNGSSSEETNALEKIKDRGTLIVGISVPWEPFEVYNATSDNYEGFDIDVITKVAQSIGVNIEFRTMEYDALFGAVQSGEVDVAISSIVIRPDLAESVDFSAPYYVADQAVLVREDSTISGADGLNGTAVAARIDSIGAFWIEENLNATGVDYETIIDAALAVETSQDEVQSAILDAPFANRYAADPNYSLKVAFVIPTNEQYSIACPKDQAELVTSIDNAINAMKADGSLEAMLDKWA